MKVSIIRIKAQDTLNIIVDSIHNALNQRVFMIIPEGSDVLYSEIGLETLFKKALEYGKELVISVPDVRALELAKRVGLVATTDKDVFTMDYKLWQRAHDLLINYKTHALYDRKVASNPQLMNKADSLNDSSSSNNVYNENLNNNISLNNPSKPKKLVGQDFSSKVQKDSSRNTTIKKHTIRMTNNKGKLVLPGGNNNSLNQPKKTKTKINLKLILGIITFSLIAVLGILFWVYYRFFTKVYIYFTLPRTTIEKTYTVTGELGVEGSILASKKFALKKYEKEVSGHLTEKATKEQQDGTYATGTVTVVNNDSSPIDISVGQIFIGGDKQFKATTAVSINPGESKPVSVQAVDYGDSYNLAANQVFTINGITQSYSATNATAFSGGSLRQYTVVSKDEVEKVAEKLHDQLLDQAKEGLGDVYKDQDYELIPQTFQDLTGKEIKYEVSPKVGEEATEFDVKETVKVRALYAHKPSLQALIKQLIISDYKKERNLNDNIVVKLDDFSFDVIKIQKVDDKHVKYTVKARASIVPSVDFSLLKDKVLGVDLQTLSNQIEEDFNTLILSYRIVYIPNWMPSFLQKVPSSKHHIIIIVEYKEQ